MSTLGLLETIWLSRNDPRFIAVGDAVEKVEFPSTDSLQTATKSDLAEADKLLQRVEALIRRSSVSARNSSDQA